MYLVDTNVGWKPYWTRNVRKRRATFSSVQIV